MLAGAGPDTTAVKLNDNVRSKGLGQFDGVGRQSMFVPFRVTHADCAQAECWCRCPEKLNL